MRDMEIFQGKPTIYELAEGRLESKEREILEHYKSTALAVSRSSATEGITPSDQIRSVMKHVEGAERVLRKRDKLISELMEKP